MGRVFGDLVAPKTLVQITAAKEEEVKSAEHSSPCSTCDDELAEIFADSADPGDQRC